MFNMIGKSLVIFGIIVIIAGIVMIFWGKIPFLGKLPGDIVIKKKTVTIYIPIITCILISIILTIVLNIIGRLFK
ncbi:MAG: DUF2905 domain-containing protein [Thermotoga sp.]|nr:DUF2905 domain-containing protein [Thermotogota bacterium]RKX55371.1 MAG: DUF2905 domain-containing protein [Thermotoga sp.]